MDDTQYFRDLSTVSKKYNIIYADPPWSFNNKNTGGSMTSGASSVYPVMTVEQICKLPVPSITDDNCILFLWWVASQPMEALSVVGAWGFKLKTMTGFDWAKTTTHGKPFFGLGSEHCLIAVKGKPKKISGSIRACLTSTVGPHSEKPALVRDLIVQLCGNIPRIELFSRQKVSGWDAFGNAL